MQLLIIILLLLPGSLFAQERGGGGRGAAPLPPPKNLKLLDPKTEIRFVMQSFNEALGVQCTHCHMQGDFASDENPKKEVARKMISMVRLIDTSFPSSAGVFPVGSKKSRAGPATAAIRIPSAWAIRRILRRSQSREGNVHKRHKVEPQKAQKLLLLCLFVIFIVPFVIHSPFG